MLRLALLEKSVRFFSVVVPLTDPAQICASPQPAAAAVVPGAVDRVRVLVIDNDPAILDGMTRLLRSWGCRVAAAADKAGAETRIGAEGFRPDIVLADYHLDAGQRGTELIIALRHALDEDIPAADAGLKNEVLRPRPAGAFPLDQFRLQGLWQHDGVPAALRFGWA